MNPRTLLVQHAQASPAPAPAAGAGAAGAAGAGAPAAYFFFCEISRESALIADSGRMIIFIQVNTGTLRDCSNELMTKIVERIRENMVVRENIFTKIEYINYNENHKHVKLSREYIGKLFKTVEIF